MLILCVFSLLCKKAEALAHLEAVAVALTSEVEALAHLEVVALGLQVALAEAIKAVVVSETLLVTILSVEVDLAAAEAHLASQIKKGFVILFQ